MAAGRAGEAPSTGLTERLVELGFETDRLKTGTPARVDKRTVDFSGGWWSCCCGLWCGLVCRPCADASCHNMQEVALTACMLPVAFAGLEAQPGDDEVRWFSFDPAVQRPREQLSCYLTHTTPETHRILRVGSAAWANAGDCLKCIS